MWVCNEAFNSYVLTTINEYRILWFRWFRINQTVPLIHNPCYDGEYSCNRIMTSIAKTEKLNAKEWLFEYKNR